MRAELQKSIDENLEALRKITNSLFAAKFVAKEAENLREGAKKRVESAESYKNALMRLGEKKFRVISHGVSRFVEHFNQLNGHEFVISNMNMQNIQEQVSEALNVVNKCKGWVYQILLVWVAWVLRLECLRLMVHTPV
ncbi:hypothetical protein MPG56_03565 [Helicobacter pylori]|uniref:hypothetical protein n=1 Tax=Helicobacter pylori TaxID=210 RepID=UPI001FD495EE|nr:hypothetical protein [Helicobacter pylori]UOR48374.1 hypothetical protein MPG56_03565 [Helicobacter pylori]